MLSCSIFISFPNSIPTAMFFSVDNHKGEIPRLIDFSVDFLCEFNGYGKSNFCDECLKSLLKTDTEYHEFPIK